MVCCVFSQEHVIQLARTSGQDACLGFLLLVLHLAWLGPSVA